MPVSQRASVRDGASGRRRGGGGRGGEVRKRREIDLCIKHTQTESFKVIAFY